MITCTCTLTLPFFIQLQYRCPGYVLSPPPPSPPPPSQVSDLARECLISLTSPVNSPHWIREELRIIGGLDTLANKGEGGGGREGGGVRGGGGGGHV